MMPLRSLFASATRRRGTRLSTVMITFCLCSPRITYSWIADQLSAQKNNLPANHKGYDNSETTVGKLLARKIQIFRVSFSVIIF